MEKMGNGSTELIILGKSLELLFAMVILRYY